MLGILCVRDKHTSSLCRTSVLGERLIGAIIRSNPGSSQAGGEQGTYIALSAETRVVELSGQTPHSSYHPNYSMIHGQIGHPYRWLPLPARDRGTHSSTI